MGAKSVHFVDSDDVKAPPKRLSASCQEVITESFTTTTARVVVRSCFADIDLFPIIAGHKCNKVPLCPSSLNADMALTVSLYIWMSLRVGVEPPGLNVSEMHVPKSLVAQIPQPDPGQYLELVATAELDDAGYGTVKCDFRAIKPDGTKLYDTAHCVVRYEDKRAWTREWERFDFMVNDQIAALHAKAVAGTAHIMQSGLAYKVFESFVTYASKYRSMNEVVFDGLEGTANLSFKTDASDHCGPYHFDGSCHLSGFLCNAYDLDTEESVYISEGWNAAKYLDLALLMKPGVGGASSLRNYVRMQSVEGGVLQGEVYILREGKIVGSCEGIRFKRLPRRVINVLLPPPKRA